MPTWQCTFQYLNATATGAVSLTRTNPADNSSDCRSCHGAYNFRYQDYCIANTLMRPYLHYNAFWQATTSSSSSSSLSSKRLHFGDLKFVALFCLTLRNDSACQQLANLCVLSHYSLEKHSPCSAFLLTQMSDVVMKYSHSGHEQLRALEPFVFYKKGRTTRELLTTSLHLANQTKQLQIFGTNYELAGRLKRWGGFQLEQLNLCPGEKVPTLGEQSEISCQLSLEQLIDVASEESNDNYHSLYLNFSSNWKSLLHQIPVLIETLTPENQVNIKFLIQGKVLY